MSKIREFTVAKVNLFYTNSTLGIKGKIVDLSSPEVIGIINLTPDSFYIGSRVSNIKDAVTIASGMLAAGASFLDVGGYSSRPGATDISIAEELKRVLPVIAEIKSKFPEAVISVDTFRSEVARQAVKEGAAIVNDISGGELDAAMFDTVAEFGIPYVLMHMKGNPATMKSLAVYDDIILEMTEYFQKKIYQLRALGVKDIILDPGFGFAKTIEHNFFLLKNLEVFRMFNLPLLAGLSRKSMIWKTLEIDPENAGNGTTVLNTIALLNGATLLRVHDVKEAVETIKLLKAYHS
jgi:dihydropteroate synthase